MKKYRLQIGLDVDDILYDCNAFALERLNREEGIDPPLRIYDINGWGERNQRLDRRIRYFSDPSFVAAQHTLRDGGFFCFGEREASGKCKEN